MRRAVSSLRAGIVLGVFAGLVGGWAGSASAETKRVGVPRFDGPQEAVVRRAVIQVLKGNGYEIVGAHAIDDAAKSTGVQLDSNDGFKAVAKELSISSFVTGEVAKKKAKLTVRNGADGSVSGEGSFAGANPGKVAAEVRGAFSRRLGSAVERGRAPTGAKAPVAVAAEPEPAEAPAAGGDEAAEKTDDSTPAKTKTTTASTDETPPAAADSGSAEAVVAKKAPDEAAPEGEVPRALEIGVGFRAFTRSLTYNDDLYGALRSYKLTLGPALAADFILYPFALTTSGLVSNFGVEGHLEYAFGVSSNIPAVPGNATLANGATLPTEVHDYWLGARGRIPFGASELALSVGGGEHAFSFRGGDLRSALADTPDTIYHYVRVGLDARFVLATGLVAGLGVGYRRVLNQGGQISDPGFFPFLTVYGVDFDAKIGYQIASSLEARLAVDVRRYAFAMHSAPADYGVNQIAGGAVDQYLSATASLVYVFGGVAGGGSSSSSGESASPAPAAEEAPPPEKKKKKKKKKSDDDDSSDEGGGDDSQ